MPTAGGATTAALIQTPSLTGMCSPTGWRCGLTGSRARTRISARSSPSVMVISLASPIRSLTTTPSGRPAGQPAREARLEGSRHRHPADGRIGEGRYGAYAVVGPVPVGAREQHGCPGLLRASRRQLRRPRSLGAAGRGFGYRTQVCVARSLCVNRARVTLMTTSASQATTNLAVRVAEAAASWLEALEPEQREKASLEFTDEAERTSWAYFPRMSKGLPLLEMDEKQQKHAHALLASALSFPAYTKVTTVMASESLVNLIEEGRIDAFRDPRRYFLAVFGSPSDERWGWRFEGHHVVLNFTLAGGEIVSPTPLFIGAQPAEVVHGHTTVLRPCGEEEDAARELLRSLDPDQRRQAIICETAPPDFEIGRASCRERV